MRAGYKDAGPTGLAGDRGRADGRSCRDARTEPASRGNGDPRICLGVLKPVTAWVQTVSVPHLIVRRQDLANCFRLDIDGALRVCSSH